MSMQMPTGVRRGVSSLLGSVLLVLMAVAVSPAWSQHGGVTWTKDLSKALTDARAAKKLVIVDVYTDW